MSREEPQFIIVSEKPYEEDSRTLALPSSEQLARFDGLAESVHDVLTLVPDNLDTELQLKIQTVKLNIEQQVKALQVQKEEMERITNFLNHKAEIIEKLEMENLEQNLRNDHRTKMLEH